MGICNQNAVTYEAFYEQYYPMVVSYLRSKCQSVQDAEDLANESFLYCYNHWKDYDPEKATLKTWVFLIVRSRWKNYLRNHKPVCSLEGLEDIIPGKEIMDQAVQLQAYRTELAEMLKTIPDRQREAIVLRYFRQWTDEEIAQWMGTSKTNVKVMIHRGIQKMNKEFSIHLRTVFEQ